MKKFLMEILEFNNLKMNHWIVIFCTYILLHLPFMFQNTGANLAVHQADAFLRGNLNIDEYFWDASVYAGKNYVSFPPFPALFVMPVVAVVGLHANTIIISILLACFSMFLLYRLLCLHLSDSSGKKWIFLAFFLGSPYWLMVMTSSHIYAFAHVVCTLLLFLLLLELKGKQRAIWIGMFWSLAFMTRQMTIFYGLVIIYYLWFEGTSVPIWKKLVPIGLTFSAVSIIYLVFNYVRFDDAFETGYRYMDYQGVIGARVAQYGIFSHHYFFFNFYHMFIKGHNLFFTGKDLLQIKGVDLFGTSLLAACPYVLFVLKVNATQKLKLFFWTTLGLILIAILFYHNNGWKQVNAQRFVLDFFPLILVMLTLSYSIAPKWLFKMLVCYAIALNVFSFVLHAMYR